MSIFKRAVCNELFGQTSFQKSCELLARHGFGGIEIAPFTLFNQDGRFSAATVSMVRRCLVDSGLDFAGFHWLFAKPEGLLMVSDDPAIRQRAWDHLRHLLETAAEFGGGPLIFGSPKQRDSGALPVATARGYLADGLRALCPVVARHNSTILIEALASVDTNLINTLTEAETFIQELGCPTVAGMFDFHNCGDETQSWDQLIRRHAGIIRHVHLNSLDGGYPTMVDSNYQAAFQALNDSGYAGWVSLEIFTEPDDPADVLRRTAGFLDQVDAALIQVSSISSSGNTVF
jgi:sugar phosphate isomerase/epimerase